MHIANVDALKEWLAKTLAPICDADPTTLARYVLALLKKEKPSSELRSVCQQELEVFLLSKTKDFVELLFTTLDNGSYDHSRPKPVTQATSLAATSSGGKLDSQKSRSPERQLSVTSKATAKLDAMATEPIARSSVIATTASVARSERMESSRTKSTSVRRSRSRDRGMFSQLGSTSSRVHRTMSSRDEENHRTQGFRTRRSRSRNRSHSRERSRDRIVPISHRLGYQGSRDLRRRVDSIRSRNDRHSRDDRLRRRRSRSRSLRARSRSRSRTRSRSRLRVSPPLRVRSQMRAYSRSRSKSRSPLSAARDPSSPTAARSPQRASRSRSSEGRDENAYRIKVPLDVVLSSNPPPPPAHSDAKSDRARGPSPFPPQVSRLPPPPSCPRCRDYDEKGFCLRGNLCPFDHGSDPLIFDDENLPGIVTFPGSQPGPLHAPPTASVRPLPPMPPVLLPGPLLAPPAAGVPLIATGASLIPSLPGAPGRNLLPSGVLLDPKYQPALNSTAVMKTDGAAMPMETSVAVPEHSVIPVLPKDSAEGKRIVIPARRQINLGVGQSGFPDNQEAAEFQDVRLVVRQPGRPLEPISTNERPLFFPKKHIFDSSRLGIRKAVGSEANSTVELTGVPTHLNTISSINQELSKYGTIVNIQVHYNGQSDRALVSFARNADAAAAFHSSEPVFNNRFVSLSWHSTDRQDSVPEVRKLSVKERLGFRPGVESSSVVHQTDSTSSEQLANNGAVREQLEKRLVVLSPSGALTKTLFNKVPPSTNNSTSSKVLDNRKTDQMKPMSNLNDLNKEQMKVKLEIAKQKQLLMKKHLEQQKALLVQLENASLSSEEKKSLLQRMKFLERRLEKMRSELQDSASSLQPLVRSVPADPTKVLVNHLPPKTFKNRVEMQKSILDAELDLIAKENQGVDTTDLRRSVAILKNQVAAQVLAGGRRGLGRGFRGRGIGRGGTFAGRGRGTTHLSLATKLIDRRPKQLVVSGFFPSDVDQIVASIAKFAGVEGTEVGPGNASVLVTFRSRHDAEKAALEGLKFQELKLLMSWYDSRKPLPAPRLEGKKEEEEATKKEGEEEEAEREEEEVEEEAEQEKEGALEDSEESEVELIVEDDDEKDEEEEELSGQVTIALDEDEALDDSELLRLEEEDDDAGPLDASWQR